MRVIIIFLMSLSFLVVSCDDDSSNSNNSTNTINNVYNNTTLNNTTNNSDCGNFTLEEGELCDGFDTGEVTCESLGFRGGELVCGFDCQSYNTDSCVPGFTTIAAGENHTCGTTSTEEVMCWGSNMDEELATTSDISESKEPIVATNLIYDLYDVKSGGVRNCGSASSNSIVCWGDDEIPFEITSPDESAIVSWDVGAAHACMATASGVWCWGNNADGQLGNDSTMDSDTPVEVQSITEVTEIVVGGYFTCAVSTSGNYCWGHGSNGEMGNGTVNDSRTPVLVDTSESGKLTNLAAGDSHVCGINASSEVYCWGSNSSGQTGTGDSVDHSTPAFVEFDGALIESLSADKDTSCAVDTTGFGWCWGYNYFDQMGVGELHGTTEVNSPVGVAMPDSVLFTAITVGGYHVCGISENNGAWCWGNNDFGQLGIGTTSAAYEPREVQ
ncbi:MAG: hypothetical protein JXR95_11575 [Deltaproteobacteria bacterium]|nr:hypothetical protein [Deltaproteobacteria bacterium]